MVGYDGQRAKNDVSRSCPAAAPSVLGRSTQPNVKVGAAVFAVYTHIGRSKSGVMRCLDRQRVARGYAWVMAAAGLAVGTRAFLVSPRSPGGCRSERFHEKVARPHHQQKQAERSHLSSSKLYGFDEWKAAQSGSARRIGFLPFPVDDVMSPGETKALHLYEARFLALFENAIKNHGGCVGGAIFVDDGVLVRVGQLCDIIAWEREEVGVSVALRCIGRVEITEVTDIDPYIQAMVMDVTDSVGSEPQNGDGNDVVSSDIFSLHRQCVEIESKMAAVAGLGWEAGTGAGVTEGGGVGDDSNSDSNVGSPRKSSKTESESGSPRPTSSEGSGGGAKNGDELDPGSDPLERIQRRNTDESLGQDGISSIDKGSNTSDGIKTNNRGDQENDDDDRSSGNDVDDNDSLGLFRGNTAGATIGDSPEGNGKGDGDNDDGDDLMARFQRGGGELDLTGLGGGMTGRGGLDVSGSALFTGEGDDEDEDDDDDDDDDDEEEEEEEEFDGKGARGEGEKGLEDLLWGHETWAADGFDVSLEEQVEEMYTSLKADLRVSLDVKRGGKDAFAFGGPAPSTSPTASKDEESRNPPFGGAKTIAELIAASSSPGPTENSRRGEGSAGSGGDSPPGERAGKDGEEKVSAGFQSQEGGDGDVEGDGDRDGVSSGEGEKREAFLWGCSSRAEEHNQLVSFVALGCFDPSARLQSLMIMSTGERLRIARDALAERLKVLVAKSALSQLGD